MQGRQALKQTRTFRRQGVTLIAALQTNDNKTFHEVRKRTEAVKNPAPVVAAPTPAPRPTAESRPAATPKPAPVVVAPKAEVAAAPAPAPKVAASPPAASVVTPDVTTEVTTEVAPKAEAPAAAVLKPSEPAANHDQYVGRSVSIAVPGSKARHTIRDAGATLKEADARTSKFEELVACLKR